MIHDSTFLLTTIAASLSLCSTTSLTTLDRGATSETVPNGIAALRPRGFRGQAQRGAEHAAEELFLLGRGALGEEQHRHLGGSRDWTGLVRRRA